MPLTFDMPLEDLKTYMGINPCPPDFDAFWDTALAELDHIDPQIEIIPSDFQTRFAECAHLYFTGVGGARIHAKLLQPRLTSGPHPAILMFHGYSGNSGDWSGKLGYVAQGFSVAVLDCRGQGGLSEDVGGVTGSTLYGHIVRGLDGPPEKLLYRQIFLDTVQLARIVLGMETVDEERIGVTGASQGGGLTLACAALEPRIQAEVFISVGLMDNVCPPSTQFAAYNKIGSHKSMDIYPDHEHENLPGYSDRIFQFLSGL